MHSKPLERTSWTRSPVIHSEVFFGERRPITLDIVQHSAYGPWRLVTLSSCEYLLARAQFRRHSRQPAIRPVLRTRQAYRGMRRLRVDRVDSTRLVRLPATARSSRRMASAPRRRIPYATQAVCANPADT